MMEEKYGSSWETEKICKSMASPPCDKPIYLFPRLRAKESVASGGRTEEFLIVTSGWVDTISPRLHVLPQVSHYRRCVRLLV